MPIFAVLTLVLLDFCVRRSARFKNQLAVVTIRYGIRRITRHHSAASPFHVTPGGLMACFRPTHLLSRGWLPLALALCLSTGCNWRGEEAVPTRGPNSRPGDSPDIASDSPWLTEITTGAGVTFTREPERHEAYFMPEIMGSGGGFLDYDGDNRLDFVLIDALWGSGADSATTQIVLYRQNDDGTFADVSALAGFRRVPGYGVGLAIGDVDADGDPDLYQTCFGTDRFYLNNGDGTFSEKANAFDVPNPRWGTAATFFDYDGDGALDLYVVNYLDYYPGTHCDDNRQRPDYCGPTAFNGTLGKLYRNLGGQNEAGNVFTDVTSEVGLTGPIGPGLGLVCRDFDGDGRPDIYIAYDQFPNPLSLQQPNGSFREDGAARGLATNGLGKPQASMGVAWGDFNADGQCDLFITNIRGEINTLYLGTPAGTFRDATSMSGIAMSSLTMTGFGVAAVDLELDGDLDLVVVNGRVRRDAPLPGSSLDTFWNDYAEPSQVFLNDGSAKFRDASRLAGILGSRNEIARSLSTGDIDDDGDLDLLVTLCAGPARLWRNDAPRRGHWLRLRLIDSLGNRDAIGARVTVRAANREFTREVNPSSSYLASNDLRLHFGLGESASYDGIEVQWRDGVGQHFPAGEADREIVLRRESPPRP